MSPELRLAIETAKEAGALLRRRAGGAASDVISSEGHDMKLKSDKASEDFILGRLQSNSDIPVLTEESGAHGLLNLKTGDAWIVDPLDGSLNFNRGIPLFCVSIAIWSKGRPRLGVVYDIERDELFSAEAGQGAWLNGKPISVSGRREAKDSVLCSGFPSKSKMDDKAMTLFAERARSFKKLRLLGAAALMLSWTACGRVDAYAEEDIMLWDVAAGLALVECAGGWIDFQPGSSEWQLKVKAGSSKDLFQERPV